jgi:hypothetical protein
LGIHALSLDCAKKDHAPRQSAQNPFVTSGHQIALHERTNAQVLIAQLNTSPSRRLSLFDDGNLTCTKGELEPKSGGTFLQEIIELMLAIPASLSMKVVRSSYDAYQLV